MKLPKLYIPRAIYMRRCHKMNINAIIGRALVQVIESDKGIAHTDCHSEQMQYLVEEINEYIEVRCE